MPADRIRNSIRRKNDDNIKYCREKIISNEDFLIQYFFQNQHKSIGTITIPNIQIIDEILIFHTS